MAEKLDHCLELMMDEKKVDEKVEMKVEDLERELVLRMVDSMGLRKASDWVGKMVEKSDHCLELKKDKRRACKLVDLMVED
jgi:hypothetical protein